MKSWRINDRIRIAEVRVIAEDGTQLGLMAPGDALKIARERSLDLVEVSPQASPPVCRIMDFPKFRYDEERRERDSKKKHHISRLKEVKFRPRIEEHDYQVKLNNLKRFLERGDKTKVTLVYRGREMAHKELGTRVLDRLVKDLKTMGKMERTPLMEGRFMTMIMSPDREGLRQLAKEKAAKEKGAKKKTSAKSVAVSKPKQSASIQEKDGGNAKTKDRKGS